MERHRSNLHANEKENVAKNNSGDKKEDEDSDKNKSNGEGNKGNDEDEEEKKNGENSTDEDVWTPLDVATDFYNRIIIDLSCKPAEEEKKPEKQEKRKSTNWWENLEF